MWSEAMQTVKDQVKAYDDIQLCDLDLSSIKYMMASKTMDETFWDAVNVKVKQRNLSRCETLQGQWKPMCRENGESKLA